MLDVINLSETIIVYEIEVIYIYYFTRFYPQALYIINPNSITKCLFTLINIPLNSFREYCLLYVLK